MAAIAAVSALGIYTVVDSAVLRVAAGQRVLYAAIAVFILCAIAVGWRRLRLPRAIAGQLAVWFALLIAWLIPVVLSDRIYPGYVIGDMASMTLPALFLLAAFTMPDAFRGGWYHGVLAAWLLLAMVAGMLLGTGWGGRFEPPHNLLVVLLWLGVFSGKPTTKWLSAFLLVCVLVLAFRSGARTVVVLWFIGLMYLLALRWPLRRLLVASVPLVAVIALFAGAALQQAALDTLAQSRFRQNIEGEADVSLISRLNEAQDVLAIVADESTPLQVILGHGHGATFRPERSLPVHNLTAHGLVHHIHITPVLLLYRYGLAGVALYFWLAWLLVRCFFAQRRECLAFGKIPEGALFTFALVLYMADSLLRNPLVDPLLSWVLAGFVAYLPGMLQQRESRTVRILPPSASSRPLDAVRPGP